MLNSLQASQIFAVMFPVTSTSSGTRWVKKIGIGWTNFAAVAMEIKKGGFLTIFDFFHQTSWNIVGIFTVVCGSFWRVDKIQNGGCCHGNQGAKIVKFIPNFKKLYSNVSCHMQICKQRY
jgi:hypothetical protein